MAEIEWTDLDSNQSDLAIDIQYTTVLGSQSKLFPNPFSIQQTPRNSILIILSANLQHGFCCYNLHFILTDRGFKGTGPNITLVTTEIVTVHWNIRECKDCQFHEKTTGTVNASCQITNIIDSFSSADTVLRTHSPESDDEIKYSIIGASAGAVLLSLVIAITVICWRQHLHKRELQERIELNDLLEMRVVSIRSGLSQPPRLPTVWEEDEEPLAQERDEEGDYNNPLPKVINSTSHSA